MRLLRRARSRDLAAQASDRMGAPDHLRPAPLTALIQREALSHRRYFFTHSNVGDQAALAPYSSLHRCPTQLERTNPMSNPPFHPTRGISVYEVADRIGISVSNTWGKARKSSFGDGSGFPIPYKEGGRTLWVEGEVEAYNQAKAATRKITPPEAP